MPKVYRGKASAHIIIKETNEVLDIATYSYVSVRNKDGTYTTTYTEEERYMSEEEFEKHKVQMMKNVGQEMSRLYG